MLSDKDDKLVIEKWFVTSVLALQEFGAGGYLTCVCTTHTR